MEDLNIKEKLETPEEIVEEVAEELQEKTREKETQEMPSGLRAFVILSLISIAVLIAGLTGVYYCYLQNRSDVEDETESVTESVDEVGLEDDTVTWVDSEGEYLKVKLPKGWTYREGVLIGDNAEEREQNFVDAGYSGLVGFVLYDEQENVIASLDYLSGPFCDPACPTNCLTLKFPDTTASEITEYESELEPLQDVNGCCSDATYEEVMEYNSVQFLGNGLRRVLDSESDFSSQYVQDRSLSRVECFESGVPVSIEEVGYGSYLLKVAAGIEDSNFDLLDQVLGKFEIIPQVDVSVEESGKSDEPVVVDACSGDEYYSLTEENSGDSLEINCGDQITITLNDPGDGGYQFEDPIFNTNFFKLVSYQDIPAESNTDIVGDFGQDIWVFKPIASGEGTIKIEASRSWNSDDRVEMFNISVVAE